MAKSLKVKTSLNEKGFVEVEARGHKIISDVTAALGGGDKGLLPGELLVGSLGACQLLTAKAYAKKFGIDLQRLSVELDAESHVNEETGKQLIPAISFNIYVESNSPEEKVKEFIEFVENSCPIGETLSNVVNLIQTKIVVQNPVKN